MTSIVSFVLAVLASLLAPFHHLAAKGEQSAALPAVERTLRWTGNPTERIFELSNINGSVRIVGEDRSDVVVKATRTVTLQGQSTDAGPVVDFREDGNRVLVCGDNRHCGCHVRSAPNGRRADEDARVDVDFEVRVPMNVTLDVCTVNNGRLQVEGMNGSFTLRHVNGAVEMDRMGGSGSVTTVNGDVTAAFVTAPAAATAFKTVNGDISVTMPPSLAADARMHTMHGDLYTNFETTQLPVTTTTERRGRRTVINTSHSRVRVGNGGPELSFDTLNGDIELKKP